MKIAYLDCFAGISGDMFLGALLHAGVPPAVLHDAVAALGLGASLKIETVDRSGISCTKVHVLEGDRLAEASFAEHQQAPAVFSQQPKTQHLHKTGHPHTHEPATPETVSAEHEHSHVHGRSLTVIRKLIEDAPLATEVKKMAIATFEVLGHSEAKIHNVPVEEIHFHEVGAIDAIADIVAASAGVHHLQIGAWYSSPLNVGGGMVQCAHGLFPVPAPATADLLRGLPTYSAHIQKELVTPTGAALIRTLAPTFGAQPAMQVEQIGYGAGSRNPAYFPNVLRIAIGNSAAAEREVETVSVLETALDDLSPQVIAYVAEQALAAGALDVMLAPVTMKKGRPGTLITILARPEDADRLTQLLLRETSTLGVRVRQDKRISLHRAHVAVETPFGNIRVKTGSNEREELNAAPEFEDCRAAAIAHNTPLKTVQAAAIAAYRQGAKS